MAWWTLAAWQGGATDVVWTIPDGDGLDDIMPTFLAAEVRAWRTPTVRLDMTTLDAASARSVAALALAAGRSALRAAGWTADQAPKATYRFGALVAWQCRGWPYRRILDEIWSNANVTEVSVVQRGVEDAANLIGLARRSHA